MLLKLKSIKKVITLSSKEKRETLFTLLKKEMPLQLKNIQMVNPIIQQLLIIRIGGDKMVFEY